MPELLSLPSELLQHIASFLPCSSVLSLLRVNHELRNVCNDRLVFQNIASHDLYYSPLPQWSKHKNPSSWSQRESILASVSQDEMVRLALAAERCIQASTADDNAWVLKASRLSNSFDVLDWLPHMLVLEQPAALAITPETLLELYGRLDPRIGVTRNVQDFYTINFAISYLVLNRLRYVNRPLDVKEPFDRHFPEDCCRKPRLTAFDGNVERIRERVPGFGQFENMFELYQATALLPTFMLELANHRFMLEELCYLPAPDKIPFASMMDMPPVFSQHANLLFDECHVEKMTSPKFLKGKWIGFLSNEQRQPGVHPFAPPMRDIQIIARTPDPKFQMTAAMIDRKTRGVDSEGEFSLQGHVFKNGFVRLVKRHIIHQWTWRWTGRLTPFGIVGVWGGNRVGDFEGYFWIWKEEWCAGT